MNLRWKSKTNVSSGEVADVHQVHHVDKLLRYEPINLCGTKYD